MMAEEGAILDDNETAAASEPVLETNSARADEEKIPRLKKQGLPLWIFKLVRCALTTCPFDAYIMFPLLCLILAAVAGITSAFVTAQLGKLIFWVLMGMFASAAMAIWLQWARQSPRVPDEKDVAQILISDGVDNWPRAPVAPVRGELVAKGGSWFRDTDGRRLLLRGINLAGGCKMPMEPPEERVSHLKATEEFYKYKGVSFVGRPFPLEEADLHLGRLRAMGLTFLRFLVTWEAVEHDGPGQYDEKYLVYLRTVVQRCADHGISVFIDFHQDVWSRWTGGDGAPAWTLEKVGFALDKLDASGAALTQQHWDEKVDGEYPKMVWNSNNSRLAAGTMWTLFFAGNDFAPKTLIDGVPVQQYLQDHFIATMTKVVEALRNEPNVVGVDILNEPSVGFVGVKDARDIGPNNYYVGWRVDPWSAMKMGAGETCEVDYFASFMFIDGTRKLNTEQVCAWRDGPTSCVWHENGVWEMNNSTGKPKLLKPLYFATNPRTREAIDFLKDYGIPFWRQAAKAIRIHIPDAIIFAEPILDMTNPSKEHSPDLNSEEVGAGYVWASHYYDGITLMTKSFSRYIGMDSVTQKPSLGMNVIQKSYGKGIAHFNHEAAHMGPGGCPVLIGECGIPFDLGGSDGRQPFFFPGSESKAAFETNDFSKCTSALDRSMRAMEHAQVSYTIWCYEPNNTNKYGDGWNGEDLSLFSRDQAIPGEENNLFDGGRSLLAAIRPYPVRVAGDVLKFSFSLYSKKRKFKLVFKADHSLATKETVVFLPKYHYPHGVNVFIKAGGGSYVVDWESQTLTYTHSDTVSHANHHIVVKKVLSSQVQ